MADGTLPALPTLDPGVYLLAGDDPTGGSLQALALDRVLRGGEALWIDGNGRANAQRMARIAPSVRLLERVHVARGFTAAQHHGLVETAADRIRDSTNVLALPGLDYRYRDDGRAERLFESTVETLERVAERREIRLLLTADERDPLTASLDSLVDARIECERTRFGPRFVGDGIETLVYPGQGYVQTTLAFWERVLERRFDARSQRREVVGVGAH